MKETKQRICQNTKKVTFGAVWQMYGKQTIEIPQDLKDEKEILNYLEEKKNIFPLPDESYYVDDSYEIDEFVDIEIL